MWTSSLTFAHWLKRTVRQQIISGGDKMWNKIMWYWKIEFVPRQLLTQTDKHLVKQLQNGNVINPLHPLFFFAFDIRQIRHWGRRPWWTWWSWAHLLIPKIVWRELLHRAKWGLSESLCVIHSGQSSRTCSGAWYVSFLVCTPCRFWLIIHLKVCPQSVVAENGDNCLSLFYLSEVGCPGHGILFFIARSCDGPA
jgi:hypothetical protein